MPTFQPASTGLDQLVVVCDLTQILGEGSDCQWDNRCVFKARNVSVRYKILFHT